MIGEHVQLCDATLMLGHEVVRCTKEAGHEADHGDDCFGTWPPCPSCGGLDEHSQKCPIREALGRTDTWAEVTWFDGAKPRVRCGRRA